MKKGSMCATTALKVHERALLPSGRLGPRCGAFGTSTRAEDLIITKSITRVTCESCRRGARS